MFREYLYTFGNVWLAGRVESDVSLSSYTS